MVWLRARAKAEVINSLYINLAKVIEEQATETMKSVRVIDAALNYPALQLNSDFEQEALKICLDDKLLSKDGRKVFSGVGTIVDGVGYLRNSHSLAHGYGAKDVELDHLTARLAVNSSVVITTFLMETLLSDKTSDPHRM